MNLKDKPVTLLVGLIVGAILGASAYQLGTANACPAASCVDSAKVTPVADRMYFSHAEQLLKGARKSIHIASFEMKYYRQFPQSKQNLLVRELIYAHERGVDVKIIVDQFSEENNAFELLREAGVEIRYDSNETTTHSKLIIVDGKIVLLGSTNLSYYGLEKNNEANVLVEDKAVAEYYEKYFWNLWRST